MAHGFRFVPRQRTATHPDNDHCPHCGARCDAGTFPYNWPHLCKEVTFGTAVAPQPMIPFGMSPEDVAAAGAYWATGPDAGEHVGHMMRAILEPEIPAGPPWVHTLASPDIKYEDGDD